MTADPNTSWTQDEHQAMVIYATMPEDPVDAMDMIEEASLETTDALFQLLTLQPRPGTNVALNTVFIPIVLRRVSELGKAIQ